MYNIFYNLDEFGAKGHNLTSKATTTVKAFMDAVRELRRVLKTKNVKLLQVGNMEFVIWADKEPRGYLSIKRYGPKTSVNELPKT